MTLAGASATERVHTAVADLDAARCSDGAPSARNLLVTVFGDVVSTVAPTTETTVQSLAAVLEDFGVNERLVRTSLSRLVRDDLLTSRADGRRSFYRVAPASIDLVASAAERIYRGRPRPWDGTWTLVVLDGGESTAEHRAELRNELAGLGLGIVAPNVMGSPIVPIDAVTEVVDRVGGFEHVLVTRSTVVPGAGMVDQVELAARCTDLDHLESSYAELAGRLAAFDEAALASLDDRRAAKLRLLVVATFRRLVLHDPMLPSELLPVTWAGARARNEAARVYAAVVERSDRFLAGVTGLALGTDRDRFRAS